MKKSQKLLIFIVMIVLTTIACVSNSTTATTPVSVDTNEAGQVQNSLGESANQEALSAGEQASQSEDSLVTEPTEEPIVESKEISTEVIQTNTYISYDSLYVIGIVQNTGNVPIDFVKIVVALRDDGGTLVSSEYSYSDIDIIQPGESSPFSVMFFEDPGGWSTYDLTVQSNESEWMTSYTDFEILSHNGRVGDYTEYEIVGEVKNIGPSRTSFVEIVAALYDENGTIIGVDFTYTDLDVIDPDGTSPFTLSILSTAEGEVASYELWVEGAQE